MGSAASELVEWHALSVEEVARALGTDIAQGLADDEARRRLEIYGPNQLEAAKKISPIRIFLKQFTNILLGILLIATFVSAFLGEVIDALVILIIVFFVAVLGFIQEYRAERSLEELRKLLSPTCRVVRGGVVRRIEVREIVPGDVVILEAGDKTPADVRLVESISLRIDESPLTGESTPVEKDVKPLPRETPLADRVNMAFSGTVVVYGRGRGVVVATGMRTELGKIARAAAEVEEEKTPLELKMAEIGRKFGAIALVVIAIIAVVEAGQEIITTGLSIQFLLDVLLFAIALAVAAIPEALPAIITASLAIGMRIMAKRNALVRRMPAVETLGATQVICFDKTGTLTRGEMTVRIIQTIDNVFDIKGTGYSLEGEVIIDGRRANLDGYPILARLARAAILCNDATLEIKDGSVSAQGDPTEVALLIMAVKLGLDVSAVRRENPRVGEIPFSPERRRMTTINLVNGVRRAYMKGAPEAVLASCSNILANGDVRRLTSQDREKIMRSVDSMASQALRVLALAEKDSLDDNEAESGFTFLGLVGMMDPPRPDAIAAVASAREAGVRPIMITGDHKLTAVAVAREAGILREGDYVITGDELERMNDEELDRIVERTTVYARISPLHKLRIVEAWRRRGFVVAMTGDGVNDAPALRRADIGIAMGRTGTEVAKESADMILNDDNFATIVKAVELGRWIYDNIKKYLAYLLQANLVEIAVIAVSSLIILRLMGFEGEEALPLLPVHILYINLATDGLPALALGFSPADPDLMKRPPRAKDEPVFTREIKLFLVRALLIEAPLLLLAFYTALPSGVEAARTRLFLMFIFIELAIAINCRSLIHPVTHAKPHRSLIIAVLWEAALIIILMNIPAAREALQVAIPDMVDLAWVVGGMLITFSSMELLKYYALRR